MKLPPRPTSVTLNLAPMVDVTMCLLVFFMLAARMVERENSHIDLPLARTARNAEKQDLGHRFVVNVRDAAEVGGEGALYLMDESAVSLDEITRRLADERKAHPDVNCIIRAERELAYRHVQALMVACARAGVQKVTFSAVPRESGGF